MTQRESSKAVPPSVSAAGTDPSVPDLLSPPFHASLMEVALEQAVHARDAGEVPIGAVVALNGEIVGRGFNQPISSGDPTAHAEIVAIRDAARATGNYRLTGAILCVTIEPCLMCVGALVHARIGTLVFGAPEPRTGAVVSTVKGGELPGHNHRFAVESGVREEACRALMQAFFQERRARQSQSGPVDSQAEEREV